MRTERGGLRRRGSLEGGGDGCGGCGGGGEGGVHGQGRAGQGKDGRGGARDTRCSASAGVYQVTYLGVIVTQEITKDTDASFFFSLFI